MKLERFLERLSKDNRRKAGTHALGPELSDAELARWKKRHRRVALPDDLLALYRRANGIKLLVTKDEPRGYLQLFPLEEVLWAPRRMYLDNHTLDDEISKSWFTLAEDADGSVFATLDAERGAYLAVDPTDPGDPTEIGADVEALLDWLADCLK